MCSKIYPVTNNSSLITETREINVLLLNDGGKKIYICKRQFVITINRRNIQPLYKPNDFSSTGNK